MAIPPPSHFVTALLLLPSWVALAWTVSRASWFWDHRADLQFGWVLLLLSGFVTWEAWEQRPGLRVEWSLGSACLGIGGLALLAVVQVYQAAFGLNAALMCALAFGCQMCVTSNVLYVFGKSGLKCFSFGFAFLLIAMPLPSAVQGPLISTLQGFISTLNVEVLNLIGVPARRVGSLIQLPGGTLGVDEACSGIRSLQATVMATLFMGRLGLKSLGFRGLLLVAGLGFAIFGNIVRSLFLSYTASSKGIAAVEHAHDTAGWSILAFTVVGVAAASWALAKLEGKQGTTKIKAES